MTQEIQHRRLRGTVVSTRMKDTIVVRVDRDVAHPKYEKTRIVSKRFSVHEPKGTAHVGDFVEIEECRPLSKTKRWRFIRTLKEAV